LVSLKDGGFQTACWSPRKFLVALLLLLAEEQGGPVPIPD